MKLLITLLTTLTASVHAIEPWADDRLPVKDGVALWLDATTVSRARATMHLPPLQSQALDVWQDGSGEKRSVRQMEIHRRPVLDVSAGGHAIKFDGTDDFLSGHGPHRAECATLFIVAAPHTNGGGYRALASFAEEGLNDFHTGLNVDLGGAASTTLSTLNIEGGGMANSAWNLLKTQFDLGTFHVFTVTADKGQTRLRADGTEEGSRPRKAGVLALVQSFIGARSYSPANLQPQPVGFFDGSIAEVILYDRVLNDSEQKQVERYLMDKHSALRAFNSLAGTKPLQRIENPAPVQFLAPGFTIKEAPLGTNFPNMNFLRYRHDGVLVAGGYNSKIYLLRDTDGDGLEDTSSLYWESDKIRVVMGMAVTPKGDARGDGVFVATMARVLFIPDRNGDDKGDEEIVVADGWPPPQFFASDVSDCLGLALDRDGSVWFGLGTKNMNTPYIPDETGKGTFNVDDERGSIFRVSADFKTRTKICSGVRYPFGFAFNAAGDLFVTDQEGATWLSNGNPFDEFLHIEKGRHYGFPPRHPQWLPNVNDEPSVFDFEPQHQSTCGFFFNERADGGPIFGREWWRGDAFICGESRGKIYRLKQVKTAAGYVAQVQLMASIPMLPVDPALSPRGDLVVTCHSGRPDWGSGPNGAGKIYHIRPGSASLPLPVLAWAAAPGEWRIAFDQPLKPEDLRDLTRRTDITAGRYVFAADRYETMRPGYRSVKNQLAAPRFDVPVLGSSLSPDGRTLTLRTAPRVQAENVAITVPTGDETPVDVQTSLHGISAVWQGCDGTNWSGWLPHPDLAVARAFTQASAEHETLWPLLTCFGTLTLRGQFDLWHMLRPAVQPGSDPGYKYAPETVSVVFTANASFRLTADGKAHSSIEKSGRHEATVVMESKQENQWLPFELSLDGASPVVTAHWFTHEDARPRALPLRRVLLPWAKSAGTLAPTESRHDIAELRGGDWVRGQALFNGKAACATCHATANTGPLKPGPNLGNLIHRDYESVVRDIREPGAAINPEHIGYDVETTDGEALAAVLGGEKDGVLKFIEATGTREVPRAKIKSMKAMSVSLMPTGLWEAMSEGERRDLMTYLLTEQPAGTRDERSIQVVILTGHDGPFHKWQDTSAALKQELERDSRMKVSIVTDPEFLATDALFQCDVLVQHYVNWERPGLSEKAKANLLKYVNAGGGLAVMHFANGAFAGAANSDWPDYRRLLMRRAWVPSQGSGHDNYGPYRVLPTKLAHPITAGLAPFDTTDELYCRQVPTGDAPEVEPLITAACRSTGKDEPLAYAFARGKGRVFQSMLGHSDVSMHAAGEFHRRGIAWASGRSAVAAASTPAPRKP